MENKKLAAIRLRGITQMNSDVEDTLKMMHLYKNNYCTILPNSPAYVGMLKKSKDYLTWGEIDEETYKALVDKRGEQSNGRESDDKNKKYKKYFRLNAPRKGLGRKGIKHSFKDGGALGYRGNAINELIKRML